MNYKPWTDEEIAILKAGRLGEKKQSFKEIGRIIGRNYKSVSAKAQKLGIVQAYYIGRSRNDGVLPADVPSYGRDIGAEVRAREWRKDSVDWCRGHLEDLVTHHGLEPVRRYLANKQEYSYDEAARAILNAQRLMREAARIQGNSVLTLATG